MERNKFSARRHTFLRGGLMEQNERVESGTAGIETVQLLIMELCDLLQSVIPNALISFF